MFERKLATAVLVVIAILLSVSTQAEVTAFHSVFNEKERVPPFISGDRIVFVGDSITHGGSYHKNIFLFNATRYPAKKLRYYNAGISGDTAEGAINRFDQDIAIHSPTVATIMLGMNDVSRSLYERPHKDSKEKASFVKQQTKIRQTYLNNIETLIQRLQALESKVILIKPSIYDETAVLPLKAAVGLSDELVNYGAELAKLAKKHNLTIVDFQTPMLRVNQQLQLDNPKATIVSEDRVHPWGPGHFVMTYAFLNDQHESKYVSHFDIDVKSKMLNHFDNCELNGPVAFQPDSLAFSCQHQALPFPVSNEQTPALDWVPFQQSFNQQLLKVSGLNKGQYQLKIDGSLVGQYTHSMLEKGINLASNNKTPMYQQELKVKALNDKRAKLSGDIRTVAHGHYRMLSGYTDVDLQDKKQVRKALEVHVEKAKGQSWYVYLKRQAEKYFETVDKVADNKRKIELLFEQIYQINQPKIHKWQLIKMAESTE